VAEQTAEQWPRGTSRGEDFIKKFTAVSQEFYTFIRVKSGMYTTTDHFLQFVQYSSEHKLKFS
jgi:hypothetical protein